MTDEELAAIEESCEIIDELGADCTTLRCLDLARADVPALIAEVRRLRAVFASINERQECEPYSSCWIVQRELGLWDGDDNGISNK